MADYVPVPVEAARQIGQTFQKGVVAIVSLDDVHQLIHTTTWGKSAEQKHVAATLGDRLAKAAGADLSQKTSFADFRDRSATEAAQDIDRLAEENRALRRLIADCQRVAEVKFSRWGLCDQIDNNGAPYMSSWAEGVIRHALGGNHAG
jgi:hypothetical protein